jgi:large subunit ribosomal protein L25
VHDLQVDPVSNVLLHVDFLAVNKNEKVTTEVSIVLVGESPLQKSGEGKIQLLKDFVEVEAFPQDLPHDIKIDITHIEKIHETVFVKDLKVSDKVRILDDQEQPVLTVLALTEEKEEAPVATDSVAAPAPAK